MGSLGHSEQDWLPMEPGGLSRSTCGRIGLSWPEDGGIRGKRVGCRRRSEKGPGGGPAKEGVWRNASAFGRTLSPEAKQRRQPPKLGFRGVRYHLLEAWIAEGAAC